MRAVFIASQVAARHMGEGGRIISIGSALAERVPAPGMTLYTMTKAALTGLTKGLARDLGPRGITATVVHGGLIDTDMNPAGGPAAELLSGITALGRYGGAEDIAAAVAHLAGDGGRRDWPLGRAGAGRARHLGMPTVCAARWTVSRKPAVLPRTGRSPEVTPRDSAQIVRST